MPDLLKPLGIEVPQSQVKISDTQKPQEKQLLKSNLPDTFIRNTAIGAGTGAVAGGALGGFAFAKPMFKSLDELFTAPADVLKKAIAKMGDTAEELFFKSISEGKIQSEEQIEKSALKMFEGMEAISVEKYRESLNKEFDIKDFKKIDTAIEKIKEKCFGKEMTAGEFNQTITDTVLELMGKTDTEKSSILEQAKQFRLPLELDTKVLIDDNVFIPMENAIGFTKSKVSESKIYLEELIKDAKDGVVTKKAYIEKFQKLLNPKQMLLDGMDIAGDDKVEIQNTLNEFNEIIKRTAPKTRIKPAVIGAAALAVVGGITAAIITKIKASKENA